MRFPELCSLPYRVRGDTRRRSRSRGSLRERSRDRNADRYDRDRYARRRSRWADSTCCCVGLAVSQEHKPQQQRIGGAGVVKCVLLVMAERYVLH